MRIRRIAWAVSAAASVVAAGCAGGVLPFSLPGVSSSAPPAAVSGHRGDLAEIRDPGQVTYSVRIHNCHTRGHGQLPDRACTPGSIDPVVTQVDIGSTICREDWTSTIRPPKAQTEHAKFDVAYPAYGIGGDPASELDHLVPLELGGSNDITNLWPELGPVPNPKDKVEAALNQAVCDGRVRLAAAQRAIARNWLTAEHRLGLTRRSRR
jgi:hypothetical protein